MIFGRQDPHIDRLGRKRIHNALMEADVSFSWHEFNGQHAFMRDEGSVPSLLVSPPAHLPVPWEGAPWNPAARLTAERPFGTPRTSTEGSRVNSRVNNVSMEGSLGDPLLKCGRKAAWWDSGLSCGSVIEPIWTANGLSAPQQRCSTNCTPCLLAPSSVQRTGCSTPGPLARTACTSATSLRAPLRRGSSGSSGCVYVRRQGEHTRVHLLSAF